MITNNHDNVPFFLDLIHFGGFGRNPKKRLSFWKIGRHKNFLLRLTDLCPNSDLFGTVAPL